MRSQLRRTRNRRPSAIAGRDTVGFVKALGEHQHEAGNAEHPAGVGQKPGR